jgi:EKC/KEOPS complex subunit CGI121/TPRKB
MERFRLELFEDTEVCLGLFSNIHNSAQLKADLKDLQCSLVNPSLVLGTEHLLLAACRALQAQRLACMKTNNLFLDLVYYLSGTSNIRESLMKYGVQDDSSQLFLVTMGPEQFETVRGKIDGELVSIEEHGKIVDLEKIGKDFRLQKNGNLESLVLSRIAIKDI